MADLSYLRTIYATPGPWASAYLDVSRNTENADHEIDVRWRHLRERLAERGADEATLDAIAEAVTRPYRSGRYGLAVFGRAGEVALVEPMPAPPPADEAAYGPVPHAMPLVAQRGTEIPYVRVMADRTGGDLAALGAGAAPRTRTVAGSGSGPVHKAGAGGWSHRRYHEAVEETWKRNAGDVAAAAADLADSIAAEVIVIGGDVKAVPMVVDRLPVRWQRRVVVVDVDARNPGADDDALEDATRVAVAAESDRRDAEAMDRYRAGIASGTAARGLAAVVYALRRAQAETVLMVDDPSSTDTLWIGLDSPTAIALSERELRAEGVTAPERVRADAALVRAIVGTDASLVLVGPDEVPLEHGIGAVLRYADASTRTE